jgi:hypothetical protein
MHNAQIRTTIALTSIEPATAPIGGAVRDPAPKAFTERDCARQQAPRLPGQRRSMGRYRDRGVCCSRAGGFDGDPANIPWQLISSSFRWISRYLVAHG